MPTFTEFYHAINGRDPFPWQVRLAKKVDEDGRWPVEIGVETGLGKTACLDIAVWWLSSQADLAPQCRTAPTRIWWVVNRRLLVDSTAEHAKNMADLLHDPGSAKLESSERKVIENVAERLRGLWINSAERPLDVISLRGGIASRTPMDPARPTVVLCTVPMYGSRLLFRGYGSRRPSVDAAMAGTDSLVLLDEAHLATHLGRLVPTLAACHPKAQKVLVKGRSQPAVVSLTATGDAAQDERFELDCDDKAHPIVSQRLDAAKPLQVKIGKSNAAKELADAAVALIKKAKSPAAFLVFCNKPKTARETFERLCKAKALKTAKVLLLTGRMREREAERIREKILDSTDGMATARAADSPRQCHLIVVATQTLEVGADIDAEYLVTEGCGVRALTQRLGRLNRLGRFPHARAIYVHVPPSPPPRGGKKAGAPKVWPVYGEEPAKVLERLQSRLEDKAETVDLSPRLVASVLGPPDDDPGRAPEILPGLLYEWTKTTTRPEGEAPVEPYFSGIAAPRLLVAVLWRAHVPAPGDRLWPRGTDREAIDVPLAEARETLKDDPAVVRLARDGVTVEKISASDLRPRDQVVIPSDAGHMDQFGWNSEAKDTVPDASLANLGLPLDAGAIKRLCGAELDELVNTALGKTASDDHDIDEAERSEAVSSILATLKETPIPDGWEETEWTKFVGQLQPRILEPRNEVPRLPVKNPDHEALSDEFDELSLGSAADELDQHGLAVWMRAKKLAERIGLPGDLVEAVERAATLHDIGKADSRFQRWLGSKGESNSLLAKSDTPRHRWETMRVAAGWPKGGRHEELSARLVRAWLTQMPDWGNSLQRKLLVHLVISHHGKGRPLVPPRDDDTTGSVNGKFDGASVKADANLAMVDWDQPRRFGELQDQLGPWGLALLEAIVIRADQAISAGVDGSLEETS